MGSSPTDRQTDRILDTPTEGAPTALPSMGHEDQLCLPAHPTRAPAQPIHPPNPYTATLRGDVRPKPARLDFYSAFALRPCALHSRLAVHYL